MALLCKSLILLPLLFIGSFASRVTTVNRLGVGFSFNVGGGHNVGFGLGDEDSHAGLGAGFGDQEHHDDEHELPQGPKVDGTGVVTSKPDFETDYLGVWKIDNPNAGVAAMQLQLMPNGKVVWFDTTNLGSSAVQFDPPFCRPLPNNPDQKDCYAHAVEYDPETSQVRLLRLMSDPWCSSGGLSINGDLVSTGGALEGTKAVRILSMNDNSELEENRIALAADRWYSSQATLEDGSFIVVGGRKSFSYEIVSPQLHFDQRLFDLPLLQETTDEKENNLYPFVFLLPDGSVYIFANSKSIIINPRTGQTIRQLPELPGGSRNYPPSAMSTFLPFKLSADGSEHNIEAEVIICGGNTRDAAKYSEFPPRTFIPALKDCNRMIVNGENPEWDREDMPSRRVMGDLLILPNGELLMLSGAKAGTSAWEAAIDPNFTPVLYSPEKPKGTRFRNLKSSQIARMYHAASALLPDGKILVAGSNPNQFYNFTVEYPTELRVEKFSPPYLASGLQKHRPIIKKDDSDKQYKYGGLINLSINLDAEVDETSIKVTMYAPPFTTHGYSQNQRLLVLGLQKVSNQQITAVAPPSGKIAPPGYYLLFVVHRGLPSEGMWVHIQN